MKEKEKKRAFMEDLNKQIELKNKQKEINKR